MGEDPSIRRGDALLLATLVQGSSQAEAFGDHTDIEWDAPDGEKLLRAEAALMAAWAGSTRRGRFTDVYNEEGAKDDLDYGTSCTVEAEVFPAGSNETVRPGPYTLADAARATAFVTEEVESLIYLGCPTARA